MKPTYSGHREFAMGKEPNNEGVSNKPEPKDETKLIVSSTYSGRKLTGVELPWRGKIGIVARQVHFYDSVEALAELPKPEDLPKILQLSQQFGIPSIWNRARPSVLETSAAALLTALRFSDRNQRIRLVQEFFKTHDLDAGLPGGRPILHPTQLKSMVRGIAIDRFGTRLQAGFETKTRLRQAGGFSSGDEEIAAELKTQGYNQAEINAIVLGATLQDAACRLCYATIRVKENVTLSTIRNCYAKYKSLR